VHVHLTYSSPGVKGRVIWGGLVASTTVWSAGAHMATSINFSQAVRVGGVLVPAGTYGFFAIAGKTEWVLILNKNANQHLADDYDAALDVVRVKATPEAVEFVPRLTYKVLAISPLRGSVQLSWEKLMVTLPIAVAE
jgi:hypothetical protein